MTLGQELSFIPITLRVDLAPLLTLGNSAAPRAPEKRDLENDLTHCKTTH